MVGRSELERLRRFADFAAIPDDAAAALVERGRVVSVEADHMLHTQGAPCTIFPLVLSGRARIFVMDADGREITLYRLHPGDGCVLAATCAVTGTPSPGFSIAESAGDALAVPADSLGRWVDRFAFWRRYVFGLVARELANVVAVANELAFRRLDARIAGYLLRVAEGGDAAVRATHDAVAREVGTRREVASRILKGFEQEGVLALERGVIRVRDRRALSVRAGSGSPP